jgi:hypothetical protein
MSHAHDPLRARALMFFVIGVMMIVVSVTGLTWVSWVLMRGLP